MKNSQKHPTTFPSVRNQGFEPLETAPWESVRAKVFPLKSVQVMARVERWLPRSFASYGDSCCEKTLINMVKKSYFHRRKDQN